VLPQIQSQVSVRSLDCLTGNKQPCSCHRPLPRVSLTLGIIYVRLSSQTCRVRASDVSCLSTPESVYYRLFSYAPCRRSRKLAPDNVRKRLEQGPLGLNSCIQFDQRNCGFISARSFWLLRFLYDGKHCRRRSLAPQIPMLTSLLRSFRQTTISFGFRGS
jgi:hypothetical protein